MHPIGEITSSGDDTFIVHAGISDPLLEQLVAFSTSNDPDLRSFTHDATRFLTREDTQKWAQDTTRKIYTLTPETNTQSLAGFGWFREDKNFHYPDTVVDRELLRQYEQVSSTQTRHTVAARIYGEYRGLKLATPFMQLAQKDYAGHIQSEVAMVLADIHRSNTASQRLFERLGYRLLGPKGNRTLWVIDAKKE